MEKAKGMKELQWKSSRHVFTGQAAPSPSVGFFLLNKNTSQSASDQLFRTRPALTTANINQQNQNGHMWTQSFKLVKLALKPECWVESFTKLNAETPHVNNADSAQRGRW